MLILTSNGISSSDLMKESKKYIKDNSKAVIITTASVEYKEKNKHIPRLMNELKQLGCVEIDFLDIEFELCDRLYEYDVIELIGGNPYFLLKQLNKNNCKVIFEKLIKEKIIIGISAGSIVFQNSIELIDRYTPQMNDTIGLKNLNGMNLINQEILPHYDRYINIYDKFEEIAKEYEMEKGKEILRLNDGQALFVLDDNYYIV